MQRKILKFIQGVEFDLIESLPNNGNKYLLIFVDFREEFSNFKISVKYTYNFVQLAKRCFTN